MGVYIKGMKMPESCILCRLECLYRIHSSSVRSKYCPLIEIAEPKDEPQTKEPKTILEELLERQTKEDIRNMKERLRKAVEDEPQTDCAWK